MKSLELTTNKELNDFGQLLLNNGFTIIAPEKPSTYFNLSKDDKIGYVQIDRFQGATFSTVHKPCTECGTGYRMTEENASLSLENANLALSFAPEWAGKKDMDAIRKYKDVAEFTDSMFHREDRVFIPKTQEV